MFIDAKNYLNIKIYMFIAYVKIDQTKSMKLPKKNHLFRENDKLRKQRKMSVKFYDKAGENNIFLITINIT